MEFKASVVVKKDGKWFAGYLDGYKFTPNKEVKKLSDVKEVTSYKTLKKYLKDTNKSLTIIPLILEKTELESIYILNKPINPSDEEFENYWWEEYNSMCKICKKDCKQSSKVIIEKCPSYEV